MITLNLLQLLEDNGLGTIDEDLFWEKLTLGKNGVYIASIGNPNPRGSRKIQTFELYSRGASDVAGCKKLRDIIDFLNASSYSVCSLPKVVDKTDTSEILSDEIDNITIMPCSTITDGGLDDNGRIIWTATGTILY